MMEREIKRKVHRKREMYNQIRSCYFFILIEYKRSFLFHLFFYPVSAALPIVLSSTKEKKKYGTN
jgi:hypothetical protein